MRRILLIAAAVAALAVGGFAAGNAGTDTYHDGQGAVTDTYHDG